MKLVDLTHTIAGSGSAAPQELAIADKNLSYTGVVYDFSHNSMVGTYIDFPGHIRETDDGRDAATYPVERLFRVDATVVHLDRQNGSGGISAAELQDACPGEVNGGALIINALGHRRFDEIDHRSVYLSAEAGAWICRTGIHLFAADVYESTPELQNIFYSMFQSGISTICQPVNLHLLDKPQVKLTALPARFEQVTQVPCRVIAEL
ncbi:MAG: cyclase family protein [Lentisphaeria bacterium]|jgi:kynurenine formamidase|nr:cyclase family protein [Lentisphaeria bacterium]MDP7742622.1 cyclase family protein [Lentisphaeria bacterium]